MRKHLLRILILLILSFCVLLGVYGFQVMTSTMISGQIHDTYYVSELWPILFIIFITLGFTSYLSSELVNRLKDQNANIILLLFALLLLFIIIFFNRQTGEFFDDRGGWVVYPPLSSFKERIDTKITTWKHLVTAGKIVLIVFCIFLAYFTFFRGNSKSGESALGPD